MEQGPRGGATDGRCICFIVPPFMLEQVARTGTQEEREAALSTMALDQTMRNHRTHLATLRAVRPRIADPLAPTAAGGKPKRTVYDAEHTENTDATKVLRAEGQAPASDQSANEAYDGLGDTYNLYWKEFHRNSIDDGGMPLLGVVHFGDDYDNAFWNGQRMVFGDGSGQLFTGFTKSIDVIGHELTHGVTQETLGLLYFGQSGALNESISDVFGSLVKQYKLGHSADKADWLIGEGILGPALKGVALRSMKAPGTAYEGDRQPAHMDDYVRTFQDNGGVHINSGIPNHAFYLAATALGGPAWERAGKIWYQTLFDRQLRPMSGFRAFAAATLRSAQRLFGAGSVEGKAVIDAWGQVGITIR